MTPPPGNPGPETAPRTLDPNQRRVLGVLIEKAKTTPAGYPMSVNAIVAGCNQKSNRDPLTALDDADVMNTLNDLINLGLVEEIDWTGRVPKYKHLAYDWLSVDRVELAVLGELLLRGAQALGELRGRAARMEPIPDLTALRPIVDGLIGRGLMVELTPPGRGQTVSHNLYQREELEELRAGFAGARPAGTGTPATVRASPEPDRTPGWSGELSELRKEVADLRERVGELEAKLGLLVAPLLFFLLAPAVSTAQPPYLHQWGASGTGSGEFDSPAGIAMPEFGDIVLVTDQHNHRVQVFTEDGVYLRGWGSLGTGPGEFDTPGGITIDAFGDVYVADTGNHRVQKFDDDGNFLLQWGGLGPGTGHFDSPQDVDATLSDEVYVVDTGNHRVQVFDRFGNFQRTWGGMGSAVGQFLSPKGITIASSNILVSDTGNQRVQAFHPAGFFVRQFGTPGPVPGSFLENRGITADCRGDIYVVDATRARILQFDELGNFFTEWGASGAGDGQFQSPLDLATRPPSGIVGKTILTGPILVADTLNDRIQAFQGPCCGGFEPIATATSAPGTVYITPAGTGETLASQNIVVSIQILNTCAEPIAGFPFQDIGLGDNAGGGEIPICNGGSVADANTDANGQTTFSGTIAGGGYTQNGVQVYLAGIPINGPPLQIDLVSADLNRDLHVNLIDVSEFALDFVNGVYDFRSDLTHDGLENLVDVSRLATHVGDMCP